MPIFEYQCNRCHREFSFLILHPKKADRLACKFCGSRNLKRLLSPFSLHETEESRLARFDTEKHRGEDFYKDSRNIGLWAKKRLREMDVDLGSKMDEIVEKGRTGKILDDHEK
ncbi:MAG TPA: zinc ribbon domain-containing protein [Thermodesulfobacteriota bacterium]|nr:zinc ribbon domain-containing protein [Thermodesulfobacteriota bacterium]